jgi:hypothetical protein
MARGARGPLIAGAAVAGVAAVVVGALWVGGDAAGNAAAGRTAAETPAAGAPTSSAIPAATPVAMPEQDEDVATDSPVPADGGNVGVVVTQAGWAASGQGVEVVGFVTGVVEDGGTCRVTLTRGDQSFSAEREGSADATTTACGSLEVGDARMDVGEWQAVLSYESDDSAGSSAPVAVLVPTR